MTARRRCPPHSRTTPHTDVSSHWTLYLMSSRHCQSTCTHNDWCRHSDTWCHHGIASLHCESKNCATFIFTVTLANVGRFLKFFQCRNQKEMAHNKNEKFPKAKVTVKIKVAQFFLTHSVHVHTMTACLDLHCSWHGSPTVEEKIQTYSSSWSSKLINLDANRKHKCNFLFVINGKFGRISHCFRDTDT